MKKILLFSSIICSLNVFSQGYWTIKSTGTSAPYVMNDASAVAVLTGSTASPISNRLSSAITLPFSNWSFYGNTVTQFKVSSSGYITFDLTQTADVINNTTLPNIAAPKNAIFAFWDNLILQPVVQGSNTFPSDVKTFTYGSAPNRVFVVQWRLTGTIGATVGTNVTYFAIRMYEAGGFDVVHNYGFGTFGATVGVQNDSATNGVMIFGSPSLNFGGNNGSYDETKSVVYKFIEGTQPNYDAALTKLTFPEFVKVGIDASLTATLFNYGKNDLSSAKVYYSIDGGATVAGTLSSLTTANSGGSEVITFPIPLNFATSGVKSIKAWVSSPNNRVDENHLNDTVTISTEALNNTVPRKVLHEIFTSSTCPPCVPGNIKLASVTAPNNGKWNVIKYQVNFPSTGDPYYTSEVGTRFSYYSATFAPWLTVDGSFNANASSYSQGLFDSYAAKPSVIDITATQTIEGKTITISGNVTPVKAFSNSNLKLRIAVVERRTDRNIKTNGETEFFNVMKKMLPNAAGTAISFAAGTAVPYSQSFTFPGDYRLPADAQTANIINLATENSVENFWNLSAVVFVEDDTKKEIWQSQSSAAVFALDVKQVNSTPQFNIYPNPAQNNFSIEFTSNTVGSVRILDLSGKVVFYSNVNSINQTIDCSNLANGLYIVQIEANGSTTSQKLNISK